MTLRTTAIIAGVLGLLMLIAGLFANQARPDPQVVTTSQVETPVVVFDPEVIALEGLEMIEVNAKGDMEAHTARAGDAEEWLKHYSATYVTGYEGWDSLDTRTASRIVADSPQPSPSPSPSAEAATAAASPSPEPVEDAAAQPIDKEMAAGYGSKDVWRSSWTGYNRLSLNVAEIAPGEVLVVFASDGSNAEDVQLTSVRQVNDGWIDPLIWIGGVLTVLGLVAALSGLIDTRPAQERAESWLRTRSRGGAEGGVRPGSRRERRLAGSTLPATSLDDTEPTNSPGGVSLDVAGATETVVTAPVVPTKKKGDAS